MFNIVTKLLLIDHNKFLHLYTIYKCITSLYHKNLCYLYITLEVSLT